MCRTMEFLSQEIKSMVLQITILEAKKTGDIFFVQKQGKLRKL